MPKKMTQVKIYESAVGVRLLDAILDAMESTRHDTALVKFKHNNKYYYVTQKNTNRILKLMADLSDTKEDRDV